MWYMVYMMMMMMMVRWPCKQAVAVHQQATAQWPSLSWIWAAEYFCEWCQISSVLRVNISMGVKGKLTPPHFLHSLEVLTQGKACDLSLAFQSFLGLVTLPHKYIHPQCKYICSRGHPIIPYTSSDLRTTFPISLSVSGFFGLEVMFLVSPAPRSRRSLFLVACW